MTGTAARWAIVVPVKLLQVAKSRLVAADDVRRDLALAMALDTAQAARDCPVVSEVVAVSDDERAAAALRELGVHVVPDVPDAGLNPALVHGARCAALRDAGALVAAMSADLPALRPADLAAMLTLATGTASAVVADAAGDGTTLLTARSAESLHPRFGERSRHSHVAAGADDLTSAAAPSVRQDVDTLADLALAAQLGCGAATTQVLHRHHELLAGANPQREHLE